MTTYDLDRMARDNLWEKVRTDFISVDGVFLPQEYERFAHAVENFEVNNDDTWVCSFQKSGTTWTQEMVWCIANDLDFEAAKVPINERFPFLEFSGVITTARVALRSPHLNMPLWITNSPKFCDHVPKPRFLKCHQPFNLLPKQIRKREKGPKIVYVARNPKDTCISFYHHSKLLEGYCGSFDDFCTQFLGDKVVYAPYWNHIKGFWDRKDWDNILFIKYEEMKKDLPSVIRRTAEFLGKTLSAEQVEALSEHLSFQRMKVNPAVNREMSIEWIRKSRPYGDHTPEGEFIRNGTCGQWKETMSADMIAKFDKWTKENLRGCDGLNL